jgi:hypothetical protein
MSDEIAEAVIGKGVAVGGDLQFLHRLSLTGMNTSGRRK